MSEGTAFRIEVHQPTATAAAATTSRSVAQGASSDLSFNDTLEQAQGLRFSNHAQKRLEHRNISLSSDELARLSQAVDKADQRGGNQSLVLVDDKAFIVNVPDRLVVTALDAGSRGEGVFTNIDSVVIADAYQTSPTTQRLGERQA